MYDVSCKWNGSPCRKIGSREKQHVSSTLKLVIVKIPRAWHVYNLDGNCDLCIANFLRISGVLNVSAIRLYRIFSSDFGYINYSVLLLLLSTVSLTHRSTACIVNYEVPTTTCKSLEILNFCDFWINSLIFEYDIYFYMISDIMISRCVWAAETASHWIFMIITSTT